MPSETKHLNESAAPSFPDYRRTRLKFASTLFADPRKQLRASSSTPRRRLPARGRTKTPTPDSAAYAPAKPPARCWQISGRSEPRRGSRIPASGCGQSLHRGSGRLSSPSAGRSNFGFPFRTDRNAADPLREVPPAAARNKPQKWESKSPATPPVFRKCRTRSSITPLRSSSCVLRLPSLVWIVMV